MVNPASAGCRDNAVFRWRQLQTRWNFLPSLLDLSLRFAGIFYGWRDLVAQQLAGALAKTMHRVLHGLFGQAARAVSAGLQMLELLEQFRLSARRLFLAAQFLFCKMF